MFHSCGTVQSSTGVPARHLGHLERDALADQLERPAKAVAGDAARDREQLADQLVQLAADLLDDGQLVWIDGGHLRAPTLARSPAEPGISRPRVAGFPRSRESAAPPLADSHFVTRTLVAAAAFLLSAAILAVGAAPTSATLTCNRFAATNGSDSAAGTSSAPYRTAQKLMDSLAAGETGCLAPGTYNESLRVNHGGQPGAPIQLTSAPGGQATLVGRLYVPQGSNDVVFSGPRPRRSQRERPAEPHGRRRPRHLRPRRRHRRPHGHLLLDRLARLGHRARRRRSTATASTTAGACHTARRTTTTASTSSPRAAP